MMEEWRSVDRRRVLLFVALAFGISWTIGLVIHLTGGLRNSPVIIAGSSVTLATVLLATGYMWAPAFAHVLTRIITDEGWNRKVTYLSPRLRSGWPYFFIAWLAPVALSAVGTVVYFLIFSSHFGSFSLPDGATGPAGGQSWGSLLVSVMVVAVALNAVFAFGEEFGWRAYLLPKLMPLGGRQAAIVLGIVWGVWHWPAIAMGHNYGVEYPGAPWTGMLAMVWFTFVVGTFLAWVTLRSGSVWPAAIGHGAVNATAGFGLLFAVNDPNPLLGPAPTGIVASVGWTLAALTILALPAALRDRT